ncbi:MAG: hypothetical protein Q9198_000016 [Flavoplaca austrocitrina]
MTLVPSLKRQRSNSPPTSNPQPTATFHADSASVLRLAEVNSDPALTSSINPHQPSPRLPLQSTASDQPGSSSPRSPSNSTLQVDQADQPTPSVPLTHANLEQLTRDLTPPSDRSRSSSSSQGETMASKAATDSTDPAVVWSNLSRNHIFYDSTHGATIGKGIITKAKEIINKPRHSAMSEKEQKAVKETIKTTKFKGETTCIIETLQVLLRTGRDKLETDQDVERWVLSAWTKDGLAKAWQTQFSANAIPQLDDKDDFWQNVPRVKTPYPDLLYAYEEEYLAQPLVDALKSWKVYLAKAMYLPFSSLDGKGVRHGIEEAETRCARTGSAMVFHLLQFLDFLSAKLAEAQKTTSASSGPTIPQPAAPSIHSESQVDESAIAFTIAFHPSKVHLFVHFAEIPMDKPTCYHMLDVGSYDFKKGEDIALLGKHINNILDWGLGARKTELERRCQEVSNAMRMAKKRKA